MEALKKSIILAVCLICTLSGTVTAQIPHRYRVLFADKNNNPFTLNRPEEFLSPRALERRTRQKIPMVKNDLPVSPLYVETVASLGAQVLSRSKWLNSIVIAVEDTAALSQLSSLPFVVSVSYVAAKKMQGTLSSENNDKWALLDRINKDNAISGSQDYKSNGAVEGLDYGPSANQAQMIKIDALHNAGFTGKGMVIAVLDAGFNSVDVTSCFQHLYHQDRIIDTRDFVHPGGQVYSENTHGAYVLSAMAAYAGGQIIGTAFDASYLLYRTEDTGSEYPVEEDYWVAGAEAADSAGADIINSSLGYNVFDDNSLSYSPAEMDGNTACSTIGADIAASKGILVVNSAGNSGGSYWQIIGAPADGDSVLAVGAVDQGGIYATFSSTGPSADGRIKPNIAAQGQGTILFSASNGLFPGSGTSFASPIIAGAAACLWQAHPQATNMEILQAIEKSANHYDNPDNRMGYGIPDFSAADKSLYMNPLIKPYDDIILYPNPSSDNLNIKIYLNDYDDVITSIYNDDGREVRASVSQYFHPGENTIQVPFMEGLASGVYFIKVRTSSRQHFAKLLKM